MASSKSFSTAGTYSTRAMRADSWIVDFAGVSGRSGEPAAASAAPSSSASESLAAVSAGLSVFRTESSARSCSCGLVAPTYIVGLRITC